MVSQGRAEPFNAQRTRVHRLRQIRTEKVAMRFLSEGEEYEGFIHPGYNLLSTLCIVSWFGPGILT
jgi:hypothetical protein